MIEFKQTTIAPAGRNKYGHYMSNTNITKSVKSTVYAGNDTTTSIGGGGGNEDTGTTNFYAMLSQTNVTFDAIDLTTGATAATQVIAYQGYNKAVTLVCDINAVSATVLNGGIVADSEGNPIFNMPTNSGMTGFPDGMSATCVDNGSSASTIYFTADSSLLTNSANTGSIFIPVTVYKRSDDLPDATLQSWYDHAYQLSGDTIIPTNNCEVVQLEFVWNVNRAASSNYIMDLSNEKAQVNCDSAGTMFSASIMTITCSASTTMNGEDVEGVQYSLGPLRFNGRGVSINQTTGVLTFNYSGSGAYFAFDADALPIDIIATISEGKQLTKTMTIYKNYPGADGSPATSHWINTSVTSIKYDPNTEDINPSAVTAECWKQVGYGEPELDSNTPMYYWWASTSPLPTNPNYTAGTPVSIEQYKTEEYLAFGLKNTNGDFYEIETVPILSSGKDGASGATGASGKNGTDGVDGKSAWYMTLSNDNASINCDSEGHILPNSVRPADCKVKLYYGDTPDRNAIYSAATNTSYTGITSSVTDGVMTIHFSAGTLDWGDDVLQITISGYTSGEVRDVKTMNVVKVKAGAAGNTPYISGGTWWIGGVDTGIVAEGESGCTPEIINGYWYICGDNTGIKAEGRDAVSYWLEPSHTEIIYNPNTNLPSPTAITCTYRRQIGQEPPTTASDCTIKYQWQRRDNTFTLAQDFPSTGKTISSADCVTNRRLRLTLMSGITQYDMEDIDILMDGLNGENGLEGRQGAAIRGPYDYASISGSTQCWCAGEMGDNNTCEECEKWIDVIKSGDTYYYCNHTYYGTFDYGMDAQRNYWTSGDSFDFVATRVLLAENAQIDFLTNNWLYLKDENGNIVGGAKGSSGGTIFWAGSEHPGNAPFRVDLSGNVYAQKGIFAGYIQFPYVNVTALTHNGGTYYADGRAYIVSYPEYGGSGRELILPTPSSAWNGFTYDILVRPRLTRSENGSDLKVSASGGTTMMCYAYIEFRFSEWYRLTGGRYSITCIPDENNDYCWAITQATGGLEQYNPNAHETEYLSTLLGASYLTQGMITKVVTHSGNTSHYISTSDNTMFIKK